MKKVQPATMISGYDCEFISPEEFSPVHNGWRVGDRRRSTIVCAGGGGTYGRGRSIGRFVILRTNDVQGTQDLDKVDVPGAGPLTITRAPLGRSVVTSAQSGTLEFRGANGVSGTLDLNDDTVTLNP